MQLKMNSHFGFRYVGKTDSITISVWNHKKVHKKQGAGFLGCVRLLSRCAARPRRGGISGCGAVAPGHLGFGRPGFGPQGMDSAVVVHRPSCSAACGIFLDQAWNQWPLH